MAGSFQQSPEQTILCQQCCTWHYSRTASSRRTWPATHSGRAPRKDGIPVDIYKAAGPVAVEASHSVITSIWEDEDMPQELRDASVVSLFKNRGSIADYRNYRGISLLSIDGKIIARIALNHLIASIWNKPPGITVWVSPWQKYYRHGICN